MIARRPNPRKRAARRGTAAFEMLLMIPLLTLVIFGAAGIGDLIVTEQLIDESAGRAARTAAMGGSRKQVCETVYTVLGPNRAKHAKIYVGPVGGKDKDDYFNCSDETAIEKPITVPSGELVEVRVELEAKYATVTRLAPVSGSEVLIGRTVMQRE